MPFTSPFKNNPTGIKLYIITSLIVGVLIGATLQSLLSTSSSSYDLGIKHGIVTRLADIDYRPTSHIDDKGRPIMKQQLLEPFVVPNFVGFSIGTFKPGQTLMPQHAHKSMHEFFYILEGKGVIKVDNVEHEVSPGTFLHMAPH